MTPELAPDRFKIFPSIPTSTSVNQKNSNTTLLPPPSLFCFHVTLMAVQREGDIIFEFVFVFRLYNSDVVAVVEGV